MARPIPEQNSSTAVVGTQLIPLFTIGQDGIVSQSVDDVTEHLLTADDPSDTGPSKQVGGASKAARADHVHEVADGSITTDKLEDDAVDSDKIGIDAVQTDHINDGAVTEQKMASNSVGTDNLIDGEITSAKIQDGTLAAADMDTSINRRLAPDPQSQPDGSVVQVSNGVYNLGGIRQAANWADPGSVLVPGDNVTIALNADGNYVISASGGGSTPPPSTHQRYAAYKRRLSTAAVSTFSAAEYQAGVSSMVNAVTLSGATDAANSVFDIAFWSAQPITFIGATKVVPPGDNIFSSFTAGRLQIGNVNGYTYQSNGLLHADQINDTWTVR